MLWALLLLALDDIHKVANDLKPSGITTYQVEPDLIIGGEDAEDHALFTPTAVAVAGDDGAIYVLDPGNYRVVVFNASGEMVRMFGQRGQGPGEFDEPVAMALSPKGEIHIFDTGSMRMQVFSVAGEVLREARFESSMHGAFQPAVLENGHVLMTCMKLSSELQMTYYMLLFDEEMKERREYSAVSQPKLDWNKVNDSGFWATFLADHFTLLDRGFPMVAPIGGKAAAIIRTNAYEGQVCNLEGDITRTFTKEYKPKLFTDEAKRATFEQIWQSLAANPALSNQLTQQVFERALAKTETSPRLPPVFAIAAFGKGFVTLVNFDPVTRQGELDFFDAEGRIVGQGAFRGHLQYLTGAGDRLYAVGLDAADNVVVTRYAVRAK